MITRERRQYHVDETNKNLRASGFEPDAEILELQRRFVEGEISAFDLIDWVTASLRKHQIDNGHDVPLSKGAN